MFLLMKRRKIKYTKKHKKTKKNIQKANSKKKQHTYIIKDLKCTKLNDNFIPSFINSTIKTHVKKKKLEKLRLFYKNVFNIEYDYIELDKTSKKKHKKGYIYSNKKYCEIFNNDFIKTPEILKKKLELYFKNINLHIRELNKYINKYKEVIKSVSSNNIILTKLISNSNNNSSNNSSNNLLLII